jgi:opacity protein-like surface antigen
MKKIALVTFLISSFALPAFAKTQGSYVGLDFVNSRMKFYETVQGNTTPLSNRKPSSSEKENYGVGLSYKYALNYKGLFFAPGIIAEYNNAEIEREEYNDVGQNQSIKVQSRLGFKADFGFDIGDYVAPYITGGYAGINYRTRNVGNDSIESYGHKSATAAEFFYGGGLKINLGRNVALNVEYNIQEFDADTLVVKNTKGLQAYYNTRFDVLKAGLSYNF